MKWVPVGLLVILFAFGAWYLYGNVTATLHEIPSTDGTVDDTVETSIEQEPFEKLPDETLSNLLVFVSNDLNLSSSEIVITASSKRDWPDGCLGLQRADEMCTMALVPGYEVKVEAGEITATYRLSMNGEEVRKVLDM